MIEPMYPRGSKILAVRVEMPTDRTNTLCTHHKNEENQRKRGKGSVQSLAAKLVLIKEAVLRFAERLHVA